MTDSVTVRIAQTLPDRVEQVLAQALRHQQHETLFLSLDADLVRRRLASLLARHQAGEHLPLLGTLIAHKDLFVTADEPTTAGSKLLAGYRSPFDATVVARLANAGAISLGKLSLDEFGMGSTNENCAYGALAHPLDASRVPGGSSGGSAVAVARGLVDCATGTDTGGSVRQPAAFCGLTGLKPSYGRVSRWGMVAYASSLDQAGLIGRDLKLCMGLYSVIAGPDGLDATVVRRNEPLFEPPDDEPKLHGVRVGRLTAAFGAGVDPQVAAVVDQALEQLHMLGAEIIDIDIAELELAIAAYYVIATAEASSNLARFDGVRYGQRVAANDIGTLIAATRSAGFGAEVQRRILSGCFVLSEGYAGAYYRRALAARQRISEAFDRAFAKVDVLAGPTTPTLAFARGASRTDPAAIYRADLTTVPANLAGLPALSLPCGRVSGLPVGLQLQAPRLAEARLARVGYAFQAATDWHRVATASEASDAV